MLSSVYHELLILSIYFFSNLRLCDMATGGVPFVDSEEELQNWTVTNSSLDDRLNNTVRRLALNITMHTSLPLLYQLISMKT